ncbi:hypothetical protein [Geomonas subterranea]|uniref:DUF4124 domain-containing protein n=1 Tax=Geomonas subterranea TaxID=2847989 RepID=A0ABX8LDH1_9BACT|nr:MULTISPECIES: hypothetical protein [Geomonas]QXE89758.1 hypothetical protein KP001_15155 [Geomonas subterranea]QXM08124.1 hypothetical protein KP002_14125 [Geomonas subterranea]
MKALIAVLMFFMSATAVSAEFYTWKDGSGTRFYTNSLNEIPARYLKKARVLDVATGKLGGLATAQPATPAASAAPARGAAPAPATQPLLVQQAPGQPGETAPAEPAQPGPAGVAGAAGAPVTAPPPTAPVVAPAPTAQNPTRPAGRMSRRELRALGRRSNNTGEE